MRIQEKVYWYSEKGALDANTYVIEDEITVLIDPGLENYLGQLLKELHEDGIDAKDIDLITLTHLHPDHCSATAALKKTSGAKVALHQVQKENLDSLTNKMIQFFGSFSFAGIGVKKFDVDFFFDDSDKLILGNTELKILPTPGHSPESICFYAADKKILICGDLVFDKSVGRTDLPGGSGEDLKKSINTISSLDTELLLPGHMGILKGKKEIEENYEFIKNYYLDKLEL